jgi:hypothetical protein
LSDVFVVQSRKTCADDWRVGGGVLQSRSIIEKDVATGKVLNTLHWDRIDSNVPISTAEIENPARTASARGGL